MRMKLWNRIIYGAVGVAGIGTLWWLIQDWATYVNMGLWTSIGIVLLTIGGINWGIVAISGKKSEDLFGLIMKD